MTTDYTTGAIWSSTLPDAVRTYYEAELLQVLRTKSILVPFLATKFDYRARDTGTITYTEVLDTSPNWNPLNETDIWLTGRHLDSRQVSLTLEIHGDSIKFTDYAELIQYWNNGDLRGLVRGKLGQNMVDYLDLMARQVLLNAPARFVNFAGGNTTRAGIAQTDLFDLDMASLARVHLEEREVPGLNTVGDGEQQTIVCVTTPRVCHDIRTAAGTNEWKDAQEYAGSTRLFTGEVGMWSGVRFIRTNRLRLFNYGAVTAETTLDGATVVGQGAAATVDTVYSVGQTGATATVDVVDGSVFSAGDVITIHATAATNPAVETDGTQETRRIISIATNALSLDLPLMKPHATGATVTKGVTLHGSIFLGGSPAVFALGEMPHVFLPPTYDDMMMVRRASWRMFGKMQQHRPEVAEVYFSGGSTD